MKTPPPAPPRKPGPRRPGRPRQAQPDQRDRLLDAALACFAQRGIAATSLRDIAREAGVTPAMMNYYFGSKQRLHDAVVETRIMPLIGELRGRVDLAGDDPGALILGFVQGAHAIVARHPWLPALWVREVLSEGGALRDVLVNRIAPQVPRLLAERLAAAQRRGQINPDLDPRLLVVSLVGLTFFPLAATPIWTQLFAADDLDADALLRHTSALLMGGVSAPQGGTSP